MARTFLSAAVDRLLKKSISHVQGLVLIVSGSQECSIVGRRYRDDNSMMNSIKIETTLYDELVIYSSNGEITYKGKPDGYPVLTACATEDNKVLVLWKGWIKKYGTKDNLLLLDAQGRLLWRAQLPESNDSYTQFEYSNGRLTASSWSCYRVEIAMETGKILRREFTK